MITIDSIKKTVLLIGGLFLSVLSVNADDIQDAINSNRSPEAAAFKKYGEESVNEYTGTADISVPLYTIQNKDIEIPLVLRYDASGIKVEQEASWVGLGWDLMVGGCINYVCAGGHDMYGAPNVNSKVWTEYLTSEIDPWNCVDEIKEIDYKPNIFTHQTLKQIHSWAYRNRTFYYTYDPNDKFNWMEKRPLKYDKFVDTNVDVFFNNGMREYIDYGYGERDFYSVNVMGKSFMFFIDPFTLKVFNIGKAGEDFVVKPDYGRKTPKTGIGNQPDISGWTIKDSDGYIYYFNIVDNNATDNNAADNNAADKLWERTGAFYTISWYLTKIQSPTGETVEFKYESYEKSGRLTLAECVKLPFLHNLGEAGYCCGRVADQIRTSNDNPIQSENSGMSVTSHYLTKITTSNQTVTFSTSEDFSCSGKRLNTIKVESYDGTTIKTISFSYGSFTPSNIGGNYATEDQSIKSQYRLKLTDVKETASGETLTTSFSYNEKVKLPSKRSFAQDYWGYYNGKENNTMIPIPQSFMSSHYVEDDLSQYPNIGGADRNSDGNNMQAAVLKQIVYPTGGFTTYDYEPNSCKESHPVSNLAAAKPDFSIYTSFSYAPGTPTPVSKEEKEFTLTGDLDYSLSVRCNGTAINGSTISITIVSLSNGGKTTSIPVTFKNSNDFIKVKTGTLHAGKYKLIIGAPASGSINYGIGCQLKGHYATSPNTLTKTYTATVGGLRVSRICNYDNDNNLLNYTKYDYSGGILLNRIETIDYMRMYNGKPEPGNHSYWNISHYIDVYTITAGHPRMPAFFASCNPGIVGYSKVTKSKFNANENLEKKVVTSFKNLEPIKMRDLNNPTGLDIDYYTTLDNGVILSQEIYNASGALVATTINDYDVWNEDHYATNMVAKQKYYVLPGAGGGSVPYYEFQDRRDENYPFSYKIDTLKTAEPGCYEVLRYPFILSRNELKKTITTEYCPDGKTITTAKIYSYNDKNHQVAQIDEFRSDNVKNARNGISLSNLINRTRIKYTVDDSKYQSMVRDYHRLNGVVETQKILVDNGKENCVSTQRTDYKNGYRTFSLPISSSTSVGNAPLEIRANYTYDNGCNVRSVMIDGKETIYIWSYNSQYPIAKIEGLTFADIRNAIGQIENSQYPKEMPITDRGLRALDEMRRETDQNKISTFITTIRKKVNELGGYITTYTYKPLVGITSETLPNGMKTTYKYDGFGRLTKVLDHNGSVISTNSYNYKK